MREVLISFVGNQDPISKNTKEFGAVITLCQHLKPDIVYLMPTAKGVGICSSTEDNAKETAEYLSELRDEISPGVVCYIRPILVSDPTDFQELLPSIRENIDNILNELKREGEDFELHLNCSSGTPQMCACFYVLAHAGRLLSPHLWQVRNPKATQPGEDRVCEIKLKFLEEESIIGRLRHYLDGYHFEIMSIECQSLSEISVYSGRRNVAELVARALKAYSMWDLLHYREAYQRLNSIERRWRDTVDAGDIAVILRKQADFLSHLKSESEKETPENLVDILFNAERCFARKAYTDTLARFWRIYEGILYYRLREEYGIEPRNIASGKKLSLFEADKELRTLQDQPFLNVLKTSLKAMRKSSQQEIKVEDLLEELREKRNSSVVAHGMKPVSEEDAANSITVAKALLAKMISSGEELLKEYPLNKPQVGALLDFLAAS
ncbi:MAG: hypothetical protein XD68_0652 [Synergistales bacterium 54_24]|nr:MAG: hypothetical protein XD68_0652 [Synergistales bacterium 54_24]